MAQVEPRSPTQIRHAPTGILLDLADDDYGHPDGRELVDQIYKHCHRNKPELFCQHGHAVYLQRRAPAYDLWAISFDGSHTHHRESAGISDEHKRQVDYLMRAGQDAGIEGKTEVTLGQGAGKRVRPDLILYGPRTTAIEVQRSSLSRSSAVSRTRKAMAAGMATSVWFTDWDTSRLPAWKFRVPFVAMNQMPWDTLPARGSATVTTGLRVIEGVLCEIGAFPRCPAGKRRPCGQMHPVHFPWHGMIVDNVAAAVPTGEIVPMRFQGKDVILVSPTSLARYEDITETSAELVFNPAAEIPPQWRQRISTGCTIHFEQLMFNWSSEPLPTIQLIRGHCNAGIIPCGLPARLYPAGWRCEQHRPRRGAA